MPEMTVRALLLALTTSSLLVILFVLEPCLKVLKCAEAGFLFLLLTNFILTGNLKRGDFFKRKPAYSRRERRKEYCIARAERGGIRPTEQQRISGF